MIRDRFSGAAGGILSYFARHRTAANLLLVLLLLLGAAAFPQMRAQYFPDVVVEEITVSVSWDGAGAEAAYAAFLPAATFAMQSLEHLSCYGKRIFGLRAGIKVHDRAPALRPSEARLALARRHAAAVS